MIRGFSRKKHSGAYRSLHSHFREARNQQFDEHRDDIKKEITIFGNMSVNHSQ